MRTLLSRENIDFAPDENTFGLTVTKEKWDVDGLTKTYWKYGLPNGILVVPFATNGKFVTIEEFQPVPNQLPSFIGGGIDDGEAPLEAAYRELLEETGYVAGQLRLMTTLAENVGRSNRTISYFLATDCTKISEPEKGISVVELSPKDFWNRFHGGLTTDPAAVHDGPYTLQGFTLALAELGRFGELVA